MSNEHRNRRERREQLQGGGQMSALPPTGDHAVMTGLTDETAIPVSVTMAKRTMIGQRSAQLAGPRAGELVWPGVWYPERQCIRLEDKMRGKYEWVHVANPRIEGWVER